MILILSAAGDDHVAAVEPELRQRGASILRLDLADIPSRAQVSVAYEPGGHARITLRTRGADVDLSTITAVWSRRVRLPSPDPAITSDTLSNYVRQETADAWAGVSALLDCPWLPAPRWQELRAGYKPLQLQVASDLGFEIPSTLVTNSPEDFLDFHRRHNGAIVTKTVHNRLLPVDRPDGYDAYILTTPVANRDLVGADSIRYCPVTAQPYVDKRVELRITVVGDRVFPVEMDSQWTNHSRYDWRQGDPHHGRYAVHDLPRDVERRCVALVERLGLRYGAIDMILTPDGRYVFLEINPNGAWLWMERTTDLPIGAAIAELLVEGRVSDSPPSATGSRGIPLRPARREGAGPALATAPPTARRSVATVPPEAVSAALRLLRRVTTDGTRPDAALAALRRLSKRHRGIGMELVWEVESALGAVHYDALLRLSGGATVSLAYSPPDAVPWSLRHAHHARESDLLRVNGRTLSMQTVMGYLDGMWQDARLLQTLVDGCLVREELDAREIAVTDDEMRRASDVFARNTGLTSDDVRIAWLNARGWTTSDLDYEIRRQVVGLKLRKQIVGAGVDAYFARHGRNLDTAVFVRLRLAEGKAARDIARQAKADPGAFDRVIESALIAGASRRARREIVTAMRRDLPTESSEQIFAASPGDVLGPFASAEGHDVVRVLRLVAASLDSRTRGVITGWLFEEWLAERRSKAVVEWFWGDVERAVDRGILTGPR